MREDRGGKTVTILAAISCYGLEQFILVEGGVNAPTWCYFIAELQRKVVPKILKRNDKMKKEDILFLYDNALPHNGSIS